MTDVEFVPEDGEFKVSLILDFRDGPEIIDVYYSVINVEQLDEGEAGLIRLEAVQALIGEDQSPVGCNSCDLGDPTLTHHHACPIKLAPFMEIAFYGTAYVS